ncbi:hypothetical protein PR202_ga12546 [Eleusine coracana subsp. coracana]|uniref:Uncharacterized protein n=1 Tax=Eleusine coracana subsp. coracana TaxID=191504 RepID=A0AAV5CC11_ELECO|nr:hypothetical protein PR202_ga12546 [Eleusine coracana subsp. coracana]
MVVDDGRSFMSPSSVVASLCRHGESCLCLVPPPLASTGAAAAAVKAASRCRRRVCLTPPPRLPAVC